MMRASLEDILKRIPGPKTSSWPDGEPFCDVMRHGTMSVEVFAPRNRDTQSPHDQDELYFVVSGQAQFTYNDNEIAAKTGDVLFVPAHAKHRFHDMSDNFVTWVVFWGPRGGEI